MEPLSSQESLTPEEPKRLEKIERTLDQATRRVERMGVAIDYASREGELMRHIMKGVVEQVIAQEESERQRIAEQQRMEDRQLMRARRNKRGAYILGTAVLLGGAVYGVKEFLLPRVGKNTGNYVKESTRNLVGEMLGFKTIQQEATPERVGEKQVWLSPEEEHYILSQRQQKEQLLRLTEELTHARLQLEGWETELEENSLRESSLEYWQTRVEELERQIRSLWLHLRESQLQPAPIPQQAGILESDSK